MRVRCSDRPDAFGAEHLVERRFELFVGRSEVARAHRNLALLSRTLFALAPNASRARRRVGRLWGVGRNSGCRASAVHYTRNFVIGVASSQVGWICAWNQRGSRRGSEDFLLRESDFPPTACAKEDEMKTLTQLMARLRGALKK